MPAEWTKFEQGLPCKQEVLVIGRLTKLHPERVAAKLMAVWAWARENSVDGSVEGVQASDADLSAGHDGFGDAMVKAGWLIEKKNGIVFPNWDRHNSNGAKARALDSRRKEVRRKSSWEPDKSPVGTRTKLGLEQEQEQEQEQSKKKNERKSILEASRADPDAPAPLPFVPEPDPPKRPGGDQFAWASALPALPAAAVPPEPLVRRGVFPEQARTLAAVGVTGAHLDAALDECRHDPGIRKNPMAAALGILAKMAGVKLKRERAGNVSPDLKAANDALLRRRDQIGARA